MFNVAHVGLLDLVNDSHTKGQPGSTAAQYAGDAAVGGGTPTGTFGDEFGDGLKGAHSVKLYEMSGTPGSFTYIGEFVPGFGDWLQAGASSQNIKCAAIPSSTPTFRAASR